MLRFYIDNFEITEPDGFVGATFESGVHEKYYGFWNTLGLNQGSSNAKIKITQDEVVKYVKKQIAKYKTQASIKFKVVDDCDTSACNSVEYNIDINDYQEANCCEIDVSLKATNGDSIRNKMENKVEVTCNSTLAIKRVNGSTSTYKGVYLKDAITQILLKLAPDMSLETDWLDGCDKIFLTNGWNIRNNNKNLLLSLDQIFQGINPSENIEYGIYGNVFNVEKKYRDCRSFTAMPKQLEDIIKSINNAKLYSTINIGYKKWQGDVDQSVNEYCTVHHYDTGYSQGQNKLELLSDFITSAYLFEKTASTTDTSQNEDIFMIWKDEAISNFNYHFTPARMLERHRNYLYLSGDSKFTGGEGNTTLVQSYTDSCEGAISIVENKSFTGDPASPIEGLFNYEVTIPFTVAQLCRLKKCIEFYYCGEKITAKITKATFAIGQSSNKVTFICNSLDSN